MKFGVFTDLHYCDRENDTQRFFRNAPEKLERCIQFFQNEKADMIVCLGDLLDIGGEEWQQKQKLEQIYNMLTKSKIPFYLCLGNHDIDALAYQNILEQFLPGKKRGYYSFEKENYHFTVLDTNYDANGIHYTEKTMQWDQLYVNEDQLNWLRMDLAETEKKVIILTHGNLDRRMQGGKMDPHVIKNQKQVQEILQEHGCILAVLQGHCHTGAMSIENGIPYITLQALVDGERQTPVLLATTDAQNPGLFLRFQDLAEQKRKSRSITLLKDKGMG